MQKTTGLHLRDAFTQRHAAVRSHTVKKKKKAFVSFSYLCTR